MSPAEPAELATEQTMALLGGVLPAPPARLLEVGCGRGHLAAALGGRGYDVVALDRDPEAVAAARSLGVPAVEADFFAFRDGGCDAVLFTRSLHHIEDLTGALARAAELLRPGGLAVVDEFARERADAATAAFFYELRAVLVAAGLLDAADTEAEASAAPIDRWELDYGAGHPHRLYTGAEILGALRTGFAVEAVREVPYVYRHLGQWLERSERGLTVARALLEAEQQRLSRGELAPLGVFAAARRT